MLWWGFLLLMLVVGGETPTPLHEPNGPCHREDDNVCRHHCHHQFCLCGKGCNYRCKFDKDEHCGDRCIMGCFAQHARCVNRCQEDDS